MKKNTLSIMCKHFFIVMAAIFLVASFSFYVHISLTKQRLQDIDSFMNNERIFYIDVEEDEEGYKLLIADDNDCICPYLKHKLNERAALYCHHDTNSFFFKQRHIIFKNKV
jgi:hypothetical protein